jgi:hypothetical protein
METVLQLPPVLTSILNCAIKAPSGNNTQPWRFVVTSEKSIEIHPDFSRALPVTDADNHELYISLGCALENLLIAAREYGYYADVSFEKNTEQRTFVRISLLESDAVPKDPLFDYISQRQTTRNYYEDTQIPARDLAQLQNSFHFSDVGLHMFTTPAIIGEMLPFVIEASNRQFENPQFIDELISWFRFTQSEAEESKDGLRMDAMGLPNMGKWIGKVLMKNFVSAESESRRWKELIHHSAGLALFTAQENTEENWIQVGRAFQRFALTATKLRISHAHVNMPCEEIEVRERMRLHFRIEGIPMLLIRIGYSEKMPYSYRRPLEDVLDMILSD